MILWLDGAHDAAENMRRDAALLAAFDAAGPRPAREAVLRLYRFAPPGITLGASQRPERELDLGACRADGIGWAVRPTGGRAVFHDEEWTYALVCGIADPAWGGSLREAYGRCSALIAAALAGLGIPAELAAGRRGMGAARAAAAACFAATARHEIVLGGKKLVGSAQRRTACTILQQGSVLLGASHARLADYLRDPGARADLRRELAAGAADPGPAWRGAPLERWADAVRAALGGPCTVRHGAAGLELLTAPRGAPYAAPGADTGDALHPSDKEMRA